MSPYEGDGDIEQERAEEVGGIKPGFVVSSVERWRGAG